MQQNSNSQKGYSLPEDGITYLVGNAETIRNMTCVPAREPFDEDITDFLNEISKVLIGKKEAKSYPDVVTLAFWIRKSSVLKLKERFEKKDGNVHVGRGTAFHIAPSNVPVNYAYSLVTGLLTGNANVVRIPSKDFPQVKIINQAIEESLHKFEFMKPYLCLIRYGRDKDVNDYLSSIADVRIVWGGDDTIAKLRESPLSPRAGEITFADRYSLAVINSDAYMEMGNRQKIAEGFYNDTYLTDQNACTSPRIVVWTGGRKDEAKDIFWEEVYKVVKKKYTFQPIMGVNKLASSYLTAALQDGVEIKPHADNYLVRVQVPNIMEGLMEYKDNSGYFLEYDCEDILELKKLCDDTHCQTIGFLGKREDIFPLLKSGIKGVDRVVSIGKTMDFDFIWDGYDLTERLTRTIQVNIS